MMDLKWMTKHQQVLRSIFELMGVEVVKVATDRDLAKKNVLCAVIRTDHFCKASGG